MDSNELKEKLRNIPIDVIQQSVSLASNVSLVDILATNKMPFARKREKVAARQISMTLCKNYTKASLAYIGFHHGGHDHATVLHANKTVNNLIFSRDPLITEWFQQSDKLIKDWCRNNPFEAGIISREQKSAVVKYWIRNRVPLFVRERELISMSNKCTVCGHSLLIIDQYGNRIKTVSDSLQRSYKK
jgi:hypothetical protein